MAITPNNYSFSGGAFMGGGDSPVVRDDIHTLGLTKNGASLGNYNPLVGDATIDIPSDGFECSYGTTTASQIYTARMSGRAPYLYRNNIVVPLWKVENNKYTFRTTSIRIVDGETYLDIVDYVVEGSTWSTESHTVSGSGGGQQAYLKKVSNSTAFDTTGHTGMRIVADVDDVPSDGIYQVSVLLSVTPKVASPTKSDLVFKFEGQNGTGMPNTTFHAVVDDSQPFAQQLSFSTTLNLKAGTNSLKLSCDELSTGYLVFVDDLTVAQIVNGVYHNGDSFDEVRNLPEATTLNEDDGFLIDGLTGNPRFLLWKTFVSGILGLNFQSNPEYLYAVTDKSGTFVFGVKRDGTVDWRKGIPEHIQTILNRLISDISVQGSQISNKVDKVEGKGLIDSIFAEGVRVRSNSEYVFALVDASETFLFGIRKNGELDWAKGIPGWLNDRLNRLSSDIITKVDKVAGKSLIDAIFADGVRVTSNEEYIFAVTDSSDRVLFSVSKDGSFNWAKGMPQIIKFALDKLSEAVNGKQDKIPGKTVIDTQFSNHTSSEDNPEWFWALVDLTNRIIESISPEGIHSFNLPVNFNGGVNWSEDNISDLAKALKEGGFTGGTGDWSDNSSLEIPVPEMAIINFTNIDQMPQTKTTDAQAIMEFWDMNGNYFKKKVIANAQGSSSLSAPKKNIGIDICNDDWIGDDTFKIKFGAWVPQDSFHIKAYYTDFFRCVGLSGYDLVKRILDTRVPNTTWKKALNYGTDPLGQKSVSPQVDSGALCYPQGFLCKVYLNGVFEGLFCWQLKKHRDNYNLDKKTAENIHIEGMLGGTFFGGTIDWTAFEIRNPKDLITYSGTKYDGDNPAELIDSTSPAYDASNSKHKLSAKVKQYIIDLSNRMAQIGNDTSIFEQYFDVDSCVDYAIMSDAIYNYDYVKNIQWTTWDGLKWFVNPYDLDNTLGANSAGDGIHYPSTSHVITATNHPVTFVLGHYTSELEQRWKELRDAHIIDARAISENLEHYVRLFGKDGYKSEYDKWTNAPCNRDPIFDTDNWDLERDADGNPVIYTTPYHDWNGTQTYAPGYVVQYNLTGSSIGNFGWWFRFTAKQTNINKPPITQRGFKDNIFRVYNWLNQQISNMDVIYNYT